GNIDYETNGNIDNKEGIGNYAYNTTKPHAVSSITNVAPSCSPGAHDLTFTTFNKIQEIEEENTSDGQLYRQEFTYGPDRLRKLVETYKDGQLHKSKIYAGDNYEEEIDHETGTATQYHYIRGSTGLTAVFIANDDSAKTDNLYYIHQDYLGSILCLSDEEGNPVERYSFDAWGHRRNPTNWSKWQGDSTDYITNRGFTGHVGEAGIFQSEAGGKYLAEQIPHSNICGEHMDLFGLINMSNAVRSRTLFMSGNGRIYDPDLGRFLSPDPYVQMPDNSQNFNRYAYCLNNPLIYTDPSGEFIFTALAAICYSILSICKNYFNIDCTID
ncbi:MAG: RHS repeat domain-containing protein, partial [Bacteroidales bacterium]